MSDSKLKGTALCKGKQKQQQKKQPLAKFQEKEGTNVSSLKDVSRFSF